MKKGVTMSKLLHIESSPRKERSTSIAVAEEFIAAYREKNPEDEFEKMNLWDVELPKFNGDALDAKYAILHGKNHNPEQAHAWQVVVNVFNRFNSADKYLLSIPMWNFSVPYIFKHFVDVITQPGLAFSFAPETGYTGLVSGKPITVVYARGGQYPPGPEAEGLDLQKRYIELWLGFIGFTDIQSIVVEPTLDPSKAEEAKRTAKELARSTGSGF